MARGVRAHRRGRAPRRPQRALGLDGHLGQRGQRPPVARRRLLRAARADRDAAQQAAQARGRALAARKDDVDEHARGQLPVDDLELVPAGQQADRLVRRRRDLHVARARELDADPRGRRDVVDRPAVADAQRRLAALARRRGQEYAPLSGRTRTPSPSHLGRVVRGRREALELARDRVLEYATTLEHSRKTWTHRRMFLMSVSRARAAGPSRTGRARGPCPRRRAAPACARDAPLSPSTRVTVPLPVAVEVARARASP